MLGLPTPYCIPGQICLIVFKARGKTAKDKADKVDKTKLPELSAKEVIRIGLFTVSTL